MSNDTNNVENLVLDHLRHIRDEIKILKDGQKDIKAEILSVKKSLHNIQGDALRREQVIASVQVDIDRIKSRLDLNDA
ncbi:MAG: hypothetical protein AAGB24_06135 [Bacteroidota bacterium]